MVRLIFMCATVVLTPLLGLAWVAPEARTAGVRAVSSSSIIGAVWQDGNAAVASARVRLRNYTTGRIVDATRANEQGRFVFRNLEGGQYLIEVVSDGGKVLAAGHPLSVAPGETVATFLRLGARLPWFSGFFQNAAAAAASTASSIGLTAVAADADPCDGICCR